MRDYTCERLYRDARIMNIYEGTTQLQVVAAIRHVTTGTYLAQMKEYAEGQYSDEVAPLKARVDKMMAAYEEAVEKIKSYDNPDYITFHARRMVEMAAWTIMSYLLCYDASREPELFMQSANVYVRYAEARLAANVKFINDFTPDEAAIYNQEWLIWENYYNVNREPPPSRLPIFALKMSQICDNFHSITSQNLRRFGVW